MAELKFKPTPPDTSLDPPCATAPFPIALLAVASAVHTLYLFGKLYGLIPFNFSNCYVVAKS